MRRHKRRAVKDPDHLLVNDQRSERVELEVGEPIALHVLDARFGLAFRAGSIRGARARLYVPVATAREVRRLKDHRASRTITPDDQRPRVVTENRARHAAEMRERGGDPFAPIVLPLIEKRFDK